MSSYLSIINHLEVCNMWSAQRRMNHLIVRHRNSIVALGVLGLCVRKLWQLSIEDALQNSSGTQNQVLLLLFRFLK